MVAEALAFFPEDLYKQLAPPLFEDSNVLVRAAARRSLERRSSASGIASSTRGVIQNELEKIESKYGFAARQAALKLAEKFVELHLRSAVHDIKNVLTHFSLDVDAIARALPSEPTVSRLRRYEQGKDYLTGLVLMMTQYSEDLSLALEPEGIAAILHESVESAADQIERQGRSARSVECVVEAPDDLIVPVSRFHLVMSITNLIKNGIEAHALSATEMKPGAVRVTAKIKGDSLEISVEDTGKGITPSDLVKLQGFIPGGSSKRRSESAQGAGSGYGLPICRRYIEAHGGNLTISSIVDQGTSAVIRIPITTNNQAVK